MAEKFKVEQKEQIVIGLVMTDGIPIHHEHRSNPSQM